MSAVILNRAELRIKELEKELEAAKRVVEAARQISNQFEGGYYGMLRAAIAEYDALTQPKSYSLHP